MLFILKQLSFEVLIILAMMQVSWWVIPRPIKAIIRQATKTSIKANRKVRNHVRKHVKRVEKEKVTHMEQPSSTNVITVQFPSGKIRKYASK